MIVSSTDREYLWYLGVYGRTKKMFQILSFRIDIMLWIIMSKVLIYD